MKRTTFNILFYIKKSKLLKNGTAPIYMRVTVDGVRSEISVKRSVLPSNWDTIRNRAKGKLNNELNDYLRSIQGQIYSHHQDLQENGKVVTARSLTNAFLGIGERKWTLIDLFTEHNKRMERLVGKGFSPNTLQRYSSALKHVRTYCILQYNNVELQLNEVDHKFITGFDFYLKTVGECQHNSSMKHVKALKKVVRIGLANDYIRKDPFRNYKITNEKVDRGCLTASELQILMNKKISTERLSMVRDVFIFQCYTGLAYKDVASLEMNDIQTGIDGNKWIIKKRGKTGVECRIPILPEAKIIIDKYSSYHVKNNERLLLPVKSNQKMNAFLKEIAVLCGIDKNLTTHLARHTFATTITLTEGIPMETVSKLLGHTKIQTTQLYSKVTDNKISNDMSKLSFQKAN